MFLSWCYIWVVLNCTSMFRCQFSCWISVTSLVPFSVLSYVLWFVLLQYCEPQNCSHSPLQQYFQQEGENWIWTVLLLYFLNPASTIPPPLQHTRAVSTRGKLFLTAGDLRVLREILVAAKSYVLSPFYSQTTVLQVRMQELTCCKTAPSNPHTRPQSWIVMKEVCML